MIKKLIILSFLFTSVQASAENIEYITGKELTKENSFLIYNGYFEKVSVRSKPTRIFLWFFLIGRVKVLSPNECARVHNRNLGDTEILVVGGNFHPHYEDQELCKKSDCPEGDILIGYKRDGNKDIVPVVRNLENVETVNCEKTYLFNYDDN